MLANLKIHILNSVSRSLEGEKKDFISRFAAKLRAVELYVKWPIFMSVNETLRQKTQVIIVQMSTAQIYNLCL